MRKLILSGFLITMLFSLGNTYAEQKNSITIGNPGTPEKVTRTIKIEIYDNRFSLTQINVKRDETIRFIISNMGRMRHQMVIDTPTNLKKYAKMMYQDADAAPDGTNQVTLDPNEVKELIWQFTQTGIINFACPFPGHFKGMQGKIIVENQ